jgi:hypothetical protein
LKETQEVEFLKRKKAQKDHFSQIATNKNSAVYFRFALLLGVGETGSDTMLELDDVLWSMLQTFLSSQSTHRK